MVRPLFCLTILAVAVAAAQTLDVPVRAVTDPGVVTTRQAITPAGVPAVFEGRVYGVAFGAHDAELWVLNGTQVVRFDYRLNRVLDRALFGGVPGYQGIVFDAQRGRPLFTGSAGREGVRLATVNVSSMMPLASGLGRDAAGALALAAARNPTGHRVVAIPLTAENKLALVDAGSGEKLGFAPTGVAPFGVALNDDGTVAYVSNWGGRIAGGQDMTARTGWANDRVVVDARGVASSGSVTRIDLTSLTATHQIPVDLHPNGIVWDTARSRVYVANSNGDSVSVIDSQSNTVVRTIAVQPFSENVAGVAPGALALAPGGATLYVACGGINALAIIRTADGVIEGLIPTAWYPNAVAVSAGGTRIAVSSLLGAGSSWKGEPHRRFVHSYRGAVAVIDRPDKAQLASYTAAVAENNHLTVGPPRRQAPVSSTVKPAAIPARSGEHSLIEHVVYIIKENRTYDQVLGDLSKGNGDPSLTIFGAPVTPNQHRLAEQFVLLDNFYATGGNSADGHQWATQANETAYCLWPGYLGRSYPFDGSDPIAFSKSGFLWDYALARGRTVRMYGEYAGLTPTPVARRAALLQRWKDGDDFANEFHVTAPVAPINKVLARQYPAYSPNVPDVVRARILLADVRKWVADGRMPNLVIASLPANHTNGATPGSHTPKAMAADNDLALGQILEALSRTPFWKKMAIFVVEDDAQDGVDHVDGHRTVALAVSPYVRRGYIDSTFYSHQSMLKTIELILGLPTMSLFDLIATDMRNSFTDAPDFTAYEAVKPEQSLDETNPPAQALRGQARRAAIDSQRMDFDRPDAAPTERLNRILWGSIRGWTTPYPGARRAVFAPLSLVIDDGDRERK